MVPYDTEGDAASLTAQCIQIRAFTVLGRQTVHCNYRSPQISGLKINEVIKTRKSMPRINTLKNTMKDAERDSQSVTYRHASMSPVHDFDSITLVILQHSIIHSHSELLKKIPA